MYNILQTQLFLIRPISLFDANNPPELHFLEMMNQSSQMNTIK